MTDQTDINAQLLEQALTRVNSRIAMLVGALQADSDNVLITDEIALAKALNMRTEIASVFAKEFDGVSQTLLNSFVIAAKEASQSMIDAGIDSKYASFTVTDASVVDAMMKDTGIEITSASLAAQSQISQAVYVSVVSGGSKAELIAQCQQYLIGQTDKRGVSMLSHLDTIIRTRYMEVNSIVMQSKAKAAGVTSYKYVGGAVKDSRAWCLQHRGKIFTEDEIKAWADKQWAGKKAGDPFVIRGGWNCIHKFIPVV